MWMKQLKAIFISAYVFTVVIISGIALFRLFNDGFSLEWSGVLLTALPCAIYFGNNYRYQHARTSHHLVSITAFVTLGAFSTTSSTLYDSAQVVPLIISTAMLMLWLVYLWWYSQLDVPFVQKLAIGWPFPLLTLEDERGTAVSTTTFLGQTTMYLFYRGNWCPFCMAQVREIAAQYRELERRGVQMVLVSPQPHKQTARLAAKFQAPMTFLVDVDNRAARELGIVDEYGVPAGMEIFGYSSETVLPTVVLVDENGRILYTSQTDNYRIRPEPAMFLRVLDRFGVKGQSV
jgi:peroxiredoxin